MGAKMTTLGLSKLVHAHRNGLPVVVGTLTDADFLGCRWIQGDPIPLRRGMFCGSAVEAGESWCGEHRRVVFGEDIASGPSVQAITTAKGKVTELAPPRLVRCIAPASHRAKPARMKAPGDRPFSTP